MLLSKYAILIGLATTIALSGRAWADAKADAQAKLEAGLAQKAAKQLGQAEALFVEATRLDPSASHAWVELGNVYIEQSKFEPATQALKQAIELDADLDVARYNLAYALRRLKRYPEAVPHYRQLIERQPKDADYYFGLADALKNSDQTLEAADAYETYASLETRPANKKWVTRARTWARELRAAAASTPKPPEAGPENAAPVESQQQGKLHLSFSANQAAKKPSNLTPTPNRSTSSRHPAALTAALNHLRGQDYESAMTRLQVAQREAPADPMVLGALGAAHLGLGQGVEAERAYRRALAKAPVAAQPSFYLGIGEALRLQGRSAEAMQEYRRVIAHRDADATLTRLSRERLSILTEQAR